MGAELQDEGFMVNVLSIAMKQLLSDRTHSMGLDLSVFCATTCALGYEAVEVLEQSVGRPTTEIQGSWLVQYGLCPTAAIQRGFHASFTANAWSHHHRARYRPYDLAGMLLVHGQTEAAKGLLQAYHSAPKGVGFSEAVWEITWINPVDPREYGIEPQATTHQAQAAHLLWHDEGALSRFFDHGLGHLPHLRRVIDHLQQPRLSARLSQKARGALRQRMGRWGTRFGSLIHAYQACSPEDAAEVANQMLSGSAESLLATRSDATEKQMITGLRAIASLSAATRKAVVPRIGRAPSLQELCAVRGRGLIEILFYLPWAYLQPLGADIEHLRSHLVRFVGRADVHTLRHCLLDHEERCPLHVLDRWEVPSRPIYGLPGAEDPFMGDTGLTFESDWEPVHAKLWASRCRAQAVRDELHALGGDDWAFRVAAMLPVFDTKARYLLEIAAQDPRWVEAQQIVQKLVIAKTGQVCPISM
jgi:hypothetical protein